MGEKKNCIECNKEIFCYPNTVPICDTCYESKVKPKNVIV